MMLKIINNGNDYDFEADKLHGREIWKANSELKYYNDNLTRTFTNELKSCRGLGDIEKLVKILPGRQ